MGSDLPKQLQRCRNGGIAAVADAVQRSVLDLPVRYQMQIVRAIAGGDASFSDGVDQLLAGADWIDRDLDDEEDGERQISGLTRAQAWGELAKVLDPGALHTMTRGDAR